MSSPVEEDILFRERYPDSILFIISLLNYIFGEKNRFISQKMRIMTMIKMRVSQGLNGILTLSQVRKSIS